MKYDIKGFNKGEIIEKYKIKKKHKKYYNIRIYYRDKTEIDFLECSYETMTVIKNELDDIMFGQMQILVNSNDVALESLSEVAANKALCFNFVGKSISIIFPIALSLIFLNPLNLLLIPILLKVTTIFRNNYQLDTIDVEYDNYIKYEIFVNHKEDIEKMNIKNIDVNTIDNISVQKLKQLKDEILFLKEESKVKKKVKQ